MRLGEHIVERGEIEGGIEMVFLRVPVEELPVRFGDAQDLDIGTLEDGFEKALDMAMRESHDADAKGGGCLSGSGENQQAAEKDYLKCPHVASIIRHSGSGWASMERERGR